MYQSVADDAAPKFGNRLHRGGGHHAGHRLAVASLLVVDDRDDEGPCVPVIGSDLQLRHATDGSQPLRLRGAAVKCRWLMTSVCIVLLFATISLWSQDMACGYEYDGECDEVPGGVCEAGTDAWDCRREGPPPGPESCAYSLDGECDEPGGTGYCLPFTDSADCLAEQASPLSIFFGKDERTFPSSKQYPWSAIGRVEGSEGYCTGTLVAPHWVLTAAHCLYLGPDQHELELPTEFGAGVSGTEVGARAAVVDYRLPAQFNIREYERGSDVDGYDWALLLLARPLGDTTGWIPVARARRKELDSLLEDERAILQAGYSYDAAHLLTAHVGCAVAEIHDDNTISHECDSLQGDSGSPLLIAPDGDYRIIAIDSAAYDGEGNFPRNVAVDARAFWKGVADAANNPVLRRERR